jgi:hypothetical protein
VAKEPLRRREEEPQAEKSLGKSLKRATRALGGCPRGRDFRQRQAWWRDAGLGQR